MIITSFGHLLAAVRGTEGTHIVPGGTTRKGTRKIEEVAVHV